MEALQIQFIYGLCMSWILLFLGLLYRFKHLDAECEDWSEFAQLLERELECGHRCSDFKYGAPILCNLFQRNSHTLESKSLI